jgi:hypothetical protein
MRKILTGFMGLVMVSAVVGGVAYAAFSSQASVLGTSFSTGSADLQVGAGVSPAFASTFAPNWVFSGLYPGLVSTPTSFQLRNNSTSPVAFSITGSLRPGVTGDWGPLSSVVKVAITTSATAPAVGDPAWKTLAEWNAPGAYSIDANLPQNIERLYYFHVYTDSAAGNEIAAKSLTGVNFDFVGTQVIPAPLP